MSTVAGALALIVGALTVPVAATADTAPAAGTPETVTADALPTVQIDGVVYAQEVVGNTVYVGGSFAKARPAGAAPGTDETPRANLLAYDLTTGALISSWNPGTNGTVLDIKKSADGSRIYVAGSFSKAGDAFRYRIAAFDTATGALITSWAPETNGRVDGLAVTESTVYLAGEFTTVNGAQRTKVAAVSTNTGATTGFAADVQGGYGAKAVVVSPDQSKVVVSGSFTSVNGSTKPGRGITALNASTGAIMPWAMNSVLRNGGASKKGYGVMYSLASDGDSVYGTGAASGPQADARVFEGAFRANWSDGSLVWMEDCHGDSYDIALTGDSVYVAGHAHYCTNIGAFPDSRDFPYKNSLAFSKAPTGQRIAKQPASTVYGNFEGEQAPSLLHWYPSYVPGTYTGQSQATWQITSSGSYLLAGGEFLKVNGTAQQGIVRFATKSVAPNTQGPQVQGNEWKSTTSTAKAGNTVAWKANYDRDNQSLKYQVFRQDVGMTTPISTVDQLSNFWTRPAMSYLDTTAVAGTTYNYRVRATDALGNSTQTDWTPITTSPDAVSGPAPVRTAYDQAIFDGGVLYYWPLNESSGTAGADLTKRNQLVVDNATRGVAGPSAGAAGTAFSGAAGSGAYTKNASNGLQKFTIEAWFKTSSTSGGKVVDFGSAATGSSKKLDRQVYLDGTGRVSFGVAQNGQKTITSGAGFNDDKWHHVAASLSDAGQVLFIDGVKIGERTDVTKAHDQKGYWRLGGDAVNGWPNHGSSGYLNGSVSNVAIYGRVLPPSEIETHRAAMASMTTPPTAASTGQPPITKMLSPAAPVAPMAPAGERIVDTDAFERTVPAGGWGRTDAGGVWTISQDAATDYSVTDGTGRVAVVPGASRTAQRAAGAKDAVVRVSVATDQLATGGAASATVIGRQVGASSYSATVRYDVGGAVSLDLLRDDVVLASYPMRDFTNTPGAVLHVALSVTGTSPSVLAAKVWPSTGAEPTAWQVTATDTTAELQAAGTVGLRAAVAAASTVASTVFTWDDFTVTTP